MCSPGMRWCGSSLKRFGGVLRIRLMLSSTLNESEICCEPAWKDPMHRQGTTNNSTKLKLSRKTSKIFVFWREYLHNFSTINWLCRLADQVFRTFITPLNTEQLEKQLISAEIKMTINCIAQSTSKIPHYLSSRVFFI